jgi:nucleoside-specific outer membrane channel protein Tsx
MQRVRGFLITLLLTAWGATAVCAQDDTPTSKGTSTAEPTTTDAEAPAEQSFFFWMDNSITVLPYGWGFAVDPEEQSTLTFEHAHESAIGDLFFFIDLTRFHGVSDELGDDAKWTWYGEISPRLSVGKILDQDLSFALFRRSLFEFKDVLLAAQYERGEDPDVAEAVLVGLGFDLDVRDAGLLGRLGKFKYVQLNLYARAELTDTQRDGFRDMQVTLVAAYPLELGSTRFLVDGYFDWVVGIGSEQSSFHFNPQVKLDIGNYWDRPEKLYAGVELDFWWDKFQIEDTPSFDTNQQAVSLLLKYHF